VPRGLRHAADTSSDLECYSWPVSALPGSWQRRPGE